MKSVAKQPFFRLAALVVFILLIAFPLYQGLKEQPFHPDENIWLYHSRFFKLFFLDRNLHDPRYGHPFYYMVEPVGKYLFGLNAYLFLPQKFDQVMNMKPWLFNRDESWNFSHGRGVDADVLLVSRLMSVTFGLLTCFFLYLSASHVLGKIIGMTATLLLAYNPLFIMASQHVMTDTILSFFMMGHLFFLLLLYKSYKEGRWKNLIIFSMLTGICTALATATKGNGGLSAGILIVFFVMIVLISKTLPLISKQVIQTNPDKPILKTGTILFISTLTAFTLFVALNPYLYQNPFEHIQNMIAGRMEAVRFQQTTFGRGIFTLEDKVSLVFYRTLFPGERHYLILGNIFHFPLDLVLFISGFLTLVWKEWDYLKLNHLFSEKAILIVWVIVMFAGIIAWIPLDWDRYYLPVIPCIVVMEAYAVNILISFPRKFLTSFGISSLLHRKGIFSS